MKKEGILIGFFALILAMQIVSAGVGIKWDKETILTNEGKKECISYSVYNPWPESTYVTIELSDELKTILEFQESETKLIPADTSSNEAIPVEFCFQIPKVYQRDCWVSDYICKQECKEQQKEYSGEVIVKSVPPETTISGTGGSTTTMSVSAPLTVKIACIAIGRDFTLVYSALAIIAAIIIAVILIRKYRKPKLERDKEKLRKLQEEVKREKQKK